MYRLTISLRVLSPTSSIPLRREQKNERKGPYCPAALEVRGRAEQGRSARIAAGRDVSRPRDPIGSPGALLQVYLETAARPVSRGGTRRDQLDVHLLKESGSTRSQSRPARSTTLS